MNKYLSFTFGTSLAASAIIAGCGGDTVSVDDLFGGDASVSTMDATVVDTGAPDQAAPVVDAGQDASPCTGTLASCNGACVDTTSDGSNCGSCGTTCGANTVCSNSACVSSCANGATACGASCVDTSADPNHCGACGTVCAAGLVCSKGACATTCAAGLSTCSSGSTAGGASGPNGGSSDAGDGGATLTNRCVDTSSDDANCGGCGIVCAAGQICSNGACALTCQAGLVQCGTKCVDPGSDPTHCGATAGCGLADAGGTAGATCASGQVCSLGVCGTSCQAGFVDCNGTCVDPKTNGEFCGAAGNCTNDGTAGDSKGTICAAGTICGGSGVCQLNCQPDEIKCGTTCINPLTNPIFCGASGTCVSDGAGTDSAGATCAGGQVCSSGACKATCSTGQVTCSNACVDPQTDPNHCGATGNCNGTNSGSVCVGGQVCTKGACATSCQPDEVLCGTTCVNPLTNPGFCGAGPNCTTTPGTKCNTTGGEVCSNGICGLTCAVGLVECNGTCINPQTDTTYCGATAGCGLADAGSVGTTCGAGTVCQNGTCGTNCGAGLSVCNNQCVDENHDPAHCGSCSACAAETNVLTDVCRAPVAPATTPSCAVGTCKAGTADCNGTFTDGCEVATSTDANNCGVCGHICPTSTPYCTAGTCVSQHLLIDSDPVDNGDAPRYLGGYDAACGTQFAVSGAVSITQIAAKISFSGAANLRFGIFERATGALVYLTPSASYMGTGAEQYVLSPIFAGVTLQSGHNYDIAALGDGTVSITYYYDQTVETGTPLSTTASNPNIDGFDTPTVESAHFYVDCGVRLYGN